MFISSHATVVRPASLFGKTHRALDTKDNISGVWTMDTNKNNPVEKKQTLKGAGFLTVTPEPAVWMAPPTPASASTRQNHPWTSGLRGISSCAHQPQGQAQSERSSDCSPSPMASFPGISGRGEKNRLEISFLTDSTDDPSTDGAGSLGIA